MIFQVYLLSAFISLALADGYHAPEPYAFGYSVKSHQGEQHRHESGIGGQSVKGSYGYTDPRGIQRQVDYIADHSGFKAQVKTNEPGTASKNPASVKVISSAHPYFGAGGYGHIAGQHGGIGGGHITGQHGGIGVGHITGHHGGIGAGHLAGQHIGIGAGHIAGQHGGIGAGHIVRRHGGIGAGHIAVINGAGHGAGYGSGYGKGGYGYSGSYGRSHGGYSKSHGGW